MYVCHKVIKLPIFHLRRKTTCIAATTAPEIISIFFLIHQLHNKPTLNYVTNYRRLRRFPRARCDSAGYSLKRKQLNNYPRKNFKYPKDPIFSTQLIKLRYLTHVQTHCFERLLTFLFSKHQHLINI